MKKLILICAALVLVQTGLAVWTNFSSHSDKSRSEKGPLLKIAAAEVNELLLEDGEGHKLLLKKEKDQWQLPELASFPADTVRVQELISRLAGLQRGWPEATTAEAAPRFKVAIDHFERKLTFRKSGVDLGVLYFGSSPGLRKMYVRVNGDHEIQTLTMAQHELEIGADAWIDTGILHLKPGQVVRAELPGVKLERKNEELQPADLTANEEVVKDRRDALVKRITGLTISSVLGKEAKAEYGLATPSFRFSLELDSGERIEYVFGQPPQKEAKETRSQLPEPQSYVLKVSNRDQLFRVDGWQVDEIRKVDRASLARPKGQKQAGEGQTASQVTPTGHSQ